MSCNGIDGCWTTGEVNVGYYPFMAVHGRTPIRVGPSEDMAVIDILGRDARFGVQSTRNPGYDDHPAPRGAHGGFVWGYSFKDGVSGWVKLDQLMRDDSGVEWATGPAKADFHVGIGTCEPHGKNSSCAGVVGVNVRAINVIDTYLRYAPHSTPYWYLVKGDLVRERWRGRKNYVCVEVVQSTVCPVGIRGWVPYAALKRGAVT